MPSEFHEIFARLKDAWQVRKNKDLAACLGVWPQAVSNAVRKKRIPSRSRWLEDTEKRTNVRQTWIETGEGPREVTPDRPKDTLDPEMRQLVAIAEALRREKREDFEVLLCIATLQRSGGAEMRQYIRAVSKYAHAAQGRESSGDSFDGNTPSELACNS